MRYSHLTTDQRECIAQMRAAGHSIPQIARQLGRAPSTLYRELQRNTLPSGHYSPSRATRAAQKRRAQARSPWRIQADPALQHIIRQALAATWSPQQIVQRLRHEYPAQPQWHVGWRTIYRWLARDRAVGGQLFMHLRQRGGGWRKRYGRRSRQGDFPDRRPLSLRPEAADQRRRVGDFEGDTMCTGYRPMMVTLVDRKSRYLLAAPLTGGQPAGVNRAVTRLLGSVAPGRRHTLTLDNGREFLRHAALERRLGIMIYFAPPFQSNRRATNENTNGLLREFFPKSARMRPTRKQVDRAVDLLNNRPRKCLGWRTPAEVFFAPD